jgi:hypothetical protein
MRNHVTVLDWAMALLLQHWCCRVDICDNIEHVLLSQAGLAIVPMLNSLCYLTLQYAQCATATMVLLR